MLPVMFESMLLGAEPTLVSLTLYTDAFVIKGSIRTRQGRITDILNQADEDFLVLTDAVVDEFGDSTEKVRWEHSLRVGLLDVLLPTTGALGGAGLFLLWRARRASRRAKAQGTRPSADTAPTQS